jgi:inhibitor of cysteine peptidase
MRKLATLAVLAVLGLSVGCGGGKESAQTPAKKSGSVLTLTKDSAKEVNLERGQLVDVSLYENASTGYSWAVEDAAANVLEEAAPPSPGDDHAGPPVPGSGGTVIYHFRAKATGTGTLKLIYRRPWEKTTPPAETFSVLVKVS